MYHWDLPQSIQDAGGWPSKEVINWFTDYARVCFELFGDSVKYWLTFNEPKQACHGGYGSGDLAPVIKSAEAEYLCAHNLLLAHARAYHLYNQTFRESQKGKNVILENYRILIEILLGKVGIVIDSAFFQPETNKTEDVAAAETAQQFNVRTFEILAEIYSIFSTS